MRRRSERAQAPAPTISSVSASGRASRRGAQGGIGRGLAIGERRAVDHRERPAIFPIEQRIERLHRRQLRSGLPGNTVTILVPIAMPGCQAGRLK